MQLAECHENFRERLARMSAQYGKPAEMIYEWWKQYSNDCHNFDQSPVLSEFENWYQPKLTEGAT